MAASPLPYRPRLVDALLDEYLEQLSAVLVVGPRAAGKSTTLRLRAETVVRLDQEAEAAAFNADPDAALRGLREPVLLDEWQNAPSVLGAVKRAVDDDPRPGRFLVTGSVQAELENKVWPGTGRLVRLPMYPMAMREQLGRVEGPSFFDRLAEGHDLTVPSEVPDLRDYLELALQGGFPDPALQLQGRPRRAWLESYIEDLLTHDVEQLEKSRTKRRDAQRLRRYFEAYALNSAGVTDHKTIYEAAEVNKATGSIYERLLTDLFVVDPMSAWTSNRLKRLVLQPKRYLIDSGLMAAALGVNEDGALADGKVLGHLIDTFVAAQLRPELTVSRSRPRLFHLRTQQGRQEVDLVAELAGQRLIAIEVKAGAAPDKWDARHLAWFRDEIGERFVAGVVFHTGPQLYELDDRIIAAPICTLWAE